MNLFLDRRVSKFVGCAVGLAPFDSSAGHPHRETARIVIAPLVVALARRRAAELASPHDERFVEEPRSFKSASSVAIG